MSRLGIAVLAAGMTSAACAVAPAAPRRPADVDPTPVWRALDRGDRAAAVAAAQALGWRAAGSVEGERVRQSLLVSAGRRAELVAEVQGWQAQRPLDPDLQYLEARLFQNPQRQAARFRELARRYPEHAWIQLGLAGVAQQEGLWSEAGAHLRAAPEWSDTEDFRLVLTARQLAQQQRGEEALRLLEPAAFSGKPREALLEYLDLATRLGKSLAAARAGAEYRLRTINAAVAPGERVDRVMERLDAEVKVKGRLSLKATLALLDAYAERAGVASGWKEHPRYRVSVVGSLLQPEAGSGGPAAAWADAGRMLLAGEALTRGVELLLLRGTRRCALEWPGESVPLELVLAEDGVSTRLNSVVGGAVFHGFYVRRDYAAIAATAYAEEAAAVDLSRPFQLPPDPRDDGPWLPEDWDLPARLRAQCLAEPGADPLRLELEQVFWHESGHMPEVLTLTGEQPGAAGVLLTSLMSWLASGDALAWLEVRAQARALAIGADARWILADIVARARSSADQYREPYAELLRDLIAEAQARGLPPLPLWHTLDAGTLHQLGAAACRRGGFEPLPGVVIPRLRGALEQLLALPAPP
ncbi:MAG: hypothetical protein EYC70_04035 [Planctomycetota bacterium]|nr:MAG: hypothetical protein EYC70_04035 [Planctomycetota bacterium]